MTAETQMASQKESIGFRMKRSFISFLGGRNVARNPLISMLATYTTVAASNS
jgi:hypothetical protein